MQHFLPLEALLNLYQSLFEPHLNYCNVIWCNIYPSYLEKLQILQKKVIRVISWTKLNAPSDPLFDSFLKLTECNTFHNACVMYEVAFRLNDRLCHLIPISVPTHEYNTRGKQLIKGKKRKLKCTSLSVAVKGPRTWNEVESTIKECASLSIFKKRLKQKLLLKYV